MEKNSEGVTKMFCSLFNASLICVSIFSEKSTAGIGKEERIVSGESSFGKPEACLLIPRQVPSSFHQTNLRGWKVTLCQKPGPALKFMSAVTCVLSIISPCATNLVVSANENLILKSFHAFSFASSESFFASLNEFPTISSFPFFIFDK